MVTGMQVRVKVPHRPKTTLDIIRSLRDEKSMRLFLNQGNGFTGRQRMTRKQYYSRLSKLIDSGLVVKISGGRYEHTSTGKTILSAVELMQRAINQAGRLQAYDVLKQSEDSKELLPALVTDPEIVDIIEKNLV